MTPANRSISFSRRGYCPNLVKAIAPHMKRILTPFCLGTAVLLFGTSCKKDHDTTTPVYTSACAMSEERWAYPADNRLSADWIYTFDASGHLAKATEAVNKFTLTVSGNVITIDKINNKTVDTFTGDLWGGTPDSLSSSFASRVNNIVTHYKFTYNNQKQLVKVHIDNTTTAILTYDQQGNLQTIAQYDDKQPAYPTYLTNFSDYDDHPTGYTKLPYWKFIENNVAVLGVNSAFWAAAVSGHNPRKMRGVQYRSDLKIYYGFTTTYNYSYDDKGRTVLAAETYQGDGEAGQLSWSVNYLYPCH